MRTSVQWWNEVKADPARMEDWLIKQWRGEVTATNRIKRLADQFVADDSREAKILNVIADQELTHAGWIGDLLISRGIPIDITEIDRAESRYWAETLPGIKDFQTGTAVAAHAEGMRLERIRAIVADEESPIDIREVFVKILKDEEWHERAFTELSTEAAMDATKDNHNLGLEALGLVH